MKFGQFIEYNKRFVFKNHAESEAGRLVPALFLFFIALNLAYNKNKLNKTLDYCSRDMLLFNFIEKGLGIVFPPHFEYDFSRKMFLMFYFIN